MLSQTTLLLIVIAVLLLTGYVFYQTIITRKWRNLVPDEEKHWKLAIIYFNPDDRRVFLPKRSGLGYTVNFGNPLGVAVLIGIIALIYYLSVM